MRPRQLSVYAKQLLSCILLLSTAVLFPGHSHARDLDPNAWPLSSIGRVNVVLGAGRSMHCTGALIGPKHMLTAAHCLYDKVRETSVRPSSVHFLAGYSRGDFIGHSQALSYQIGTQFAADGRRITWAPDDWAIVELVNSLDLKPIKIQLHSAPSGIPHYIRAGYRNDRAHLLTIQRTKVSKNQGSRSARGHSAVPAFDVKRSCQGTKAAALSLGWSGPSGPRVESCINSEEAAREQLQNRWTGFSVAKRVECVGMTNIGGLPSYIEVLSCLELAQALEMIRATTPTGPRNAIKVRST
jgi:trypsin